MLKSLITYIPSIANTAAFYIYPIAAIQFQGVEERIIIGPINLMYFIISIILASAANIVYFSKEVKITGRIVFRHLFISFFVGWVTFLGGLHFNLGLEIRLTLVSLMAFLSEFFLKWISEKYPKIFDRGFDRILPPVKPEKDSSEKLDS
jgi:hypothetical protein